MNKYRREIISAAILGLTVVLLLRVFNEHPPTLKDVLLPCVEYEAVGKFCELAHTVRMGMEGRTDDEIVLALEDLRRCLDCEPEGRDCAAICPDCPTTCPVKRPRTAFVTRAVDWFRGLAIVQPLRNKTVGRVMVGGCYVIVTVAYLIMILQGYLQKSFGMPLVGSVATLGVCLLCGFIGPWSDYSYLFFDPSPAYLLTWRCWFVLQGLIYVQYVIYGVRLQEVRRIQQWFYPLVLGSFAGMVWLEWNYIIFYQDYYVNEICPIGLLITAAGYVRAAVVRKEFDRVAYRGLSVTVGWLLAFGNMLLYVAVVLGDMDDAYRYKFFGFDFIYVLYIVSFILWVVYPIILARRRPLVEASGWYDWFLRDIGVREEPTSEVATT